MGKTNYKNIKIIEDNHKLLNKKIFIDDSYALNDPLDIEQIEYWEDRLNRLQMPYVLAEVLVTMPAGWPHESGYVLFTNMKYMKQLTKENL